MTVSDAPFCPHCGYMHIDSRGVYQHKFTCPHSVTVLNLLAMPDNEAVRNLQAENAALRTENAALRERVRRLEEAGLPLTRAVVDVLERNHPTDIDALIDANRAFIAVVLEATDE